MRGRPYIYYIIRRHLTTLALTSLTSFFRVRRMFFDSSNAGSAVTRRDPRSLLGRIRLFPIDRFCIVYHTATAMRPAGQINVIIVIRGIPTTDIEETVETRCLWGAVLNGDMKRMVIIN